MSRVALPFLAPLWVIVDDDTGKVLSVEVIADEVRWDDDDVAVDRDNNRKLVSLELSRKLAEGAEESRRSWPKWEVVSNQR